MCDERSGLWLFCAATFPPRRHRSGSAHLLHRGARARLSSRCIMALREGQKAKALFDYEARAPDELSFKRRDIITVLDKDEEDEGWYRGEINGKTGLFPNNYVQLIDKPAGDPPAAAPPGE